MLVLTRLDTNCELLTTLKGSGRLLGSNTKVKTAKLWKGKRLVVDDM